MTGDDVVSCTVCAGGLAGGDWMFWLQVLLQEGRACQADGDAAL